MPTDLKLMLDVEPEIESCFDQYLTGVVTAPTTVISSDSDTSLTTPRFNIIATLLEQGRHQVTVSSGTYTGRNIYDQFRVRVEIEMIYDPSYAQGQDSIRSILRLALTDYYGIQTKFNINSYLVLASDTLRQTDGSRTINEKENEETMLTVVEGMFFLNANTMLSLS